MKSSSQEIGMFEETSNHQEQKRKNAIQLMCEKSKLDHDESACNFHKYHHSVHVISQAHFGSKSLLRGSQ